MNKLCNLYPIVIVLFSYIFCYIDNSPVISSEVIDRMRSLPTTSSNVTKPLFVKAVTESTSEACLQPTQLMNVRPSTNNLVKGSLDTLNILNIYHNDLITIDKCSLSNVPDNWYIGLVAYVEHTNREWLMQFMAAKYFDALLEVIYIIPMCYLNNQYFYCI